MKKTVYYTSIALGFVLLLVIGLVGYMKIFLPNVGPAPDITVQLTDEKIDRGRYLANHVMLCMDCHAVRDFSYFAGPPKTETLGAGGEKFNREMGLPGDFTAKNITPAALGDWTDGEIFRAITSGVSKDGSALFPVMPYPHYSKLAEDDIYAVIAYLRSIEPIESEHPPSEIDFPVSLLINTMPVKPNLQPRPSDDDPIEYGRYMITAAACTDCHTRHERGQFVGEPYAGGNEFLLPDGSIVRSANLTPHGTGIGNWTKEQFVARFKAFSKEHYTNRKVESGHFQTIMPWPMYAEMEDKDLEAIYEYLMSLPPAENRVQLFTPAE